MIFPNVTNSNILQYGTVKKRTLDNKRKRYLITEDWVQQQ